MASYAALVSLTHILDQILHHPPRQMILPNKTLIESLLENIHFLIDFLEDYSRTIEEETQELETRIESAAYAAEDAIESYVVNQILEKSTGETEVSTPFCQDIHKAIEEIDSIKNEVMKINETKGVKIQQPRKSVSGNFSRSAASSGKNTMVGFDEDLIRIMDSLTGYQSNLQIISIVGMGGIGKTTLARNVYDNPFIEQHFHNLAWVTISLQFSVREILLGLLKDIGVLDPSEQESVEKLKVKTDDQLGELLHKSLSGRKYFIVMDDMWSTEAWDNIKMYLPNNNNGSRVMVTTRLLKVAVNFRSCSPYQLHFLDEDKSWTLFCDKVFAQEGCPPELEEIGKKIVKICGGLPLAIVAISGLLAKSNGTIMYWEFVAKDINAAVNMGGDGHWREILSLSGTCQFI